MQCFGRQKTIRCASDPFVDIVRPADELPVHIKIEFWILNANLVVCVTKQLICSGVNFKLMERRMDLVVRLLALMLLFSFRPALAQEAQTGTGLICDTQAQVSEYVKQATHLNNREAALEVVNKTSPKACGIAAVVFFPGKVAGTVQTPKGLYDIVEITVVAGFDGQWHPIPAIEQYTLVRSEGQEI